MFPRLLLLLIVAFGLVAGRAWTGEVRMHAADLECGCCPVEVESCCVSTPEGTAERDPIRGVVSGHDLKGAVEPVMVSLGTLPEPVAATRYRIARKEIAGRGAGRLIDRICIRLI